MDNQFNCASLDLAEHRAFWNSGMADQDIHIRLAVGAFDAAAQFWAALHCLLQLEFGAEQICLAALEETVTTTARAASIPANLNQFVLDLTDKMTSIRPFGASAAKLWASDWLLDALHTDQTISADGNQQAWMHPRQKDRLVNLIDQRHVVLGVRSMDLDQHTAATRLLLDHSVIGVQTHEFAIPSRRQ